MDSLDEVLEKLDIGKTNTLDEVLEKFDNLSSHDSHEEWDILELNYAKLRFIKSMEHKLVSSRELIEKLSKFLISIDKINQYYLKTIAWDIYEDDDIKSAAELIKESLEKSLNFHCPFEKINKILDGYQILVEIAEDVSNQKMQDTVDVEFVEEFCGKRRRTK